MNFQVKLFNWQDQGKHVVVLARGCMERAGFRKLFDEIENATRGLNRCKVLVDLSDGTYAIDTLEIEGLVAELPLDRWARANKIAFVSAPGSADYHRLYFLRIGLVGRGLSAAVFHNPKIAIDWLAGMM
jgi:hypothetical protein